MTKRRAKKGNEKRRWKDPTGASPVKLLQAELHLLRRELHITARAYTARLETELLARAAALGCYGPTEKLSRERLHRVRDLTIMVRKRRLKPEKGRRKDLRKIDMVITDLQPLVEDVER
jgi:hypothetical protein